jgi:hypothetical protein
VVRDNDSDSNREGSLLFIEEGKAEDIDELINREKKRK